MTPAGMEFFAWRRGLLRDHCPSWGELYSMLVYEGEASEQFAAQLSQAIAGNMAALVAARSG